MPTMFIGCRACNTLLVLSTDRDSFERARAAGWQSTADGWECPKHVPPECHGVASPQEKGVAALTAGSPPP